MNFKSMLDDLGVYDGEEPDPLDDSSWCEI